MTDYPTCKCFAWAPDTGILSFEEVPLGSHMPWCPLAATLAHPDEPHEFTTTCHRCGKSGYLHVALITDDERVTIEPLAALTPEPTDGPAPAGELPLDARCANCGHLYRFAETDTHRNHRCPKGAHR
jgi:hypothetical protein